MRTRPDSGVARTNSWGNRARTSPKVWHFGILSLGPIRSRMGVLAWACAHLLRISDMAGIRDLRRLGDSPSPYTSARSLEDGINPSLPLGAIRACIDVRHAGAFSGNSSMRFLACLAGQQLRTSVRDPLQPCHDCAPRG